MIGISAIASYIPPGRESNLEKIERFETDEAFIREKIGVETVSRKSASQQTSDLCVEAWKKLLEKEVIDPTQVDCAIVCTQHPDGRGIPNVAAIVHGKLGLSESCAAFDISLGCSGFVYSLSIIKSFMEANFLRCGVLFTCDPYSPEISPNDKNTVLLFGDAATVTLLQQPEKNQPGWIPKNFIFGTRGRDGIALHNREGMMQMDGRAVFNFSATAVPAQIKTMLQKENLTLADIDLFVFHQGSKFIVDTLQKRLGINAEKVPCNLASQGNTVSSSIPLLLENYLSRTDLRRILLSGFGVGLSWASCLLEPHHPAN